MSLSLLLCVLLSHTTLLWADTLEKSVNLGLGRFHHTLVGPDRLSHPRDEHKSLQKGNYESWDSPPTECMFACLWVCLRERREEDMLCTVYGCSPSSFCSYDHTRKTKPHDLHMTLLSLLRKYLQIHPFSEGKSWGPEGIDAYFLQPNVLFQRRV